MTLSIERPLERVSEPASSSASAPSRVRKFRPDIEGMRAFAVVAVVLYHANLGVRGGYVGVDVFFVISGFLITRQLTKSVHTRGFRAIPAFYTGRIRRLLPAAATVVISTVIVSRFFAPPLQVQPTAIDGLYTTFYGLNYRLAIEGTQYLHQGSAPSPLLHFWSLGVEEQFYVFWPLLVVIIGFIGRRFRTPLLFLALVAIAIISYRYSISVTETSAPWAYFSLHTRAWELSLGALVAVGAGQLARLPKRVATLGAWAGLITVVASAFVFSDATHYPGSLAMVPVAAAAVLIACGCGQARGPERILREPLLQCIGRVSYSWYLWHWPLLVMVPLIVGHPLGWIGRLGVVWLSLATAVLTYFAIENPARHTARRNWQGFSMGLIVSGAVVAASALVVSNLPAVTGSGAAVHITVAQDSTPAVVAEMQQAVATGVKTGEAPSNLTPTTSQAAQDLPAADSTNCHASFATINQGPCVYGDPAGTKTAVIVGDSHADMWLPAFNQAGLTQHWRVVDWTKSSCPVASITVYNSSLNRTYTECDTWRKSVLTRIAALKPDAIFVSDSENVVGGSVSPEQWSAANLSTLRTLQSTTTAKVTLIQDVPVPAYDMPGCVAQHLSSVQKCTFSTTKAYSFPARHRQLAADAKSAGFNVVDPQGWICTTTTCPAIVGNYLVYRDDTHLTAQFSTWLAPMVEPLLTSSNGN
jgi:peptidoglycan/LPS O-acetylase OafA/YrhL